eukprot:5201056-Pleurochrysis_carterae.AAC.3
MQHYTSSSSTLWPLAGGKGGSCRSAGLNWGSYDEVWRVSEWECQILCVQAGPMCLAYEYAVIPQGVRCELHKDLITHTLPMGGFTCR